MTKEQVYEIVQTFSIAFPNASLPPETIVLYCDMLADLPYDAAKTAVMKIIKTAKFFPTIAEIREATLRQMPGVNPPTPPEAWANVADQLQQCGTWHTPAFAHPLIAQAVRTMGWYDLCRSENPMTDRAHFLRIYGDLRDAAWRTALSALPAPGWRALP